MNLNCNPDGREVVFDGDTHEIVTDPRWMGTYNYVTPAPLPNGFGDVKGALNWAGQGAGHFFLDVAPYLIGGNVRGPG